MPLYPNIFLRVCPKNMSSCTFLSSKAQFCDQSVALNVYRDYIFVVKKLNYVLSIENISYVISVLLYGGIFKVKLQSR